MTHDEYRANPALNYSSLKNILVSPRNYMRLLGESFEETIDMRLGTNVHSFILEGKMPEYVVRPEFTPGTDEKWHGAKAACKQWLAAQTLPVLTVEEEERQMRMVKALSEDKLTQKLLNLCPEREVPIFVEFMGLPFKCRLDAFKRDGKPLILDLKKAVSADPRVFRRKTIYDFNYDFQARLYQNLVALKFELEEPPDFAWIVQEDSKAAHVQVFGMSEEIAASGDAKIDKAVNAYKECLEKGEWPGYEYWIPEFRKTPDGIIIL